MVDKVEASDEGRLLADCKFTPRAHDTDDSRGRLKSSTENIGPENAAP